MSGYQRFISYMYEYRKGKKGENCGFVKVEARDGKCLVDLKVRCRGLGANQQVRFYGFVREAAQLWGVFLGKLQTGESKIEGSIETEAENLNESGIALNQLGGMIVTLDCGVFFGTEWDDFPIRPDDFSPLEYKKPQKEEAQKEEPQREEVQKEEQIDFQEPIDETKEVVEIQEESEAEATAEQTVQYSLNPFEEEDLELQECKKISLHFFRSCDPRDRVLQNNRFLLYGYYQFGHLLLGKRKNGQFILGVPGCYEKQECFMANLFGFGQFLESALVPTVMNAKSGYWYRQICDPTYKNFKTEPVP